MEHWRWMCSTLGRDHGEPRVADADAVVAFVLEVIEECADQRSVEVLGIDLAGLFAGSPCGEGKQQPERVTVGVESPLAGKRKNRVSPAVDGLCGPCARL